MKIKTTIKGIETVLKKLNNIEKVDLPAATARALNWVAFSARNDVQFEMARVFDRPTKYTLRSVGVWKADPKERHYNQYAQVFIKNERTNDSLSPAEYLGPQIYGGTRPVKKFEKMLANAGHIKAGQFLLPYKAVKNRYGNVSAGTIQRVLSGLQAQFDASSNSPYKGKGYGGGRAGRKVQRRYNVLQRNGKTIIWEFSKGHTVPLFQAVDSVSYKKRFDFHKTVERSVSRNLSRALQREFSKK